MTKFNKLGFFKGLVLVAMFLTVLGSVAATAQSFCNSQGQSVFGRRVWIDRFETGSINNQTGNNNGYGNFTSQTVAAVAGASIPFTIVTDNNLFFSFFNARIWIDLNSDNDFTDAGELVYSGAGNGTINGSYTVPLNTTPGSKTMRVIVQRFGQPAACGNYFLGETEDYSVSVTEECNPNAGTLTATSSTVCFNNGTALLEATANGNANVPAGYQTIYVLTSGTGLVIEQVNGTPSFSVTAGGLYTIHTLVYNPATLDLSIVVPGQTTGFDVNGLLVQGGGAICASLDVAGAPITVEDPNAGTLLPKIPVNCSNGGPVSLEALPQGNLNVPAGYQVIYVLTSGTGLVIEQVNATPSFTVTAGGLYTIHTLVYNPATLDLSIVVPGQTTGFDVNGLLVQGGGAICASLDVAGAQFNVNDPNAGTLTTASSTVCFNNGTALLEATANGNANVPAGYQTIYVLTSGTGLVIEQLNATPSFSVTTGGLYTIHTLVYNPATLDLSIVVPGQTTGFDVNGLLVQGGGIICASLDVAGAPITVEDPNAGTLTATSSTVCFNNGTALLEATANGNSNVPAGYQTIYVLTSGTGLVIEQVNASPSFTVTAGGLYTIHTLVYNPATLDLSIVVPGQTTGFDVNGLLVQGGGAICASLDVAGAQFNVNDPNAGTLTATSSTVCFNNGTALLEATANGNANVPTGYQTIYVLTSGTGLVIEQVNGTPSFSVTTGGLYTIHTLVYNPATLDLSIVVPGQTTGFDVNGLLVQGGGAICASLDVAGAPITVEDPNAGTLTAASSTVCFNNGTALLEATANGDANVPAGYQTIYVLTSGTGLVIEQVNGTPSFSVTTGGLYTIHTLVYNPATLDLSIVVPGQTTGFDVNGLLVQGGGAICASLDVAGAPINVEDPNAGTLTANVTEACSFNISATPNGDQNVPTGYQTIYVLTSGAGLVIEQVNATPDFTVASNGVYTIHTLVYNPATLDLTIVVPGQTTGFDVNGLLVQGGGAICASLDVAGAQFSVNVPNAGTLTAASSTVCFNNGTALLEATANGNANVPSGYQTIYVLTSGTGLVIEQVNGTPSFSVTTGGLYTIHTLVYNPATLDLSIVVPGQTTGFDVNGLLVQGGGAICASLDVAGAPITVEDPNAGTLLPKIPVTCSNGGPVSLEALPQGNLNVPAGYQVIYVLTSGTGLVIEQVNATPSFTVTAGGLYTIHTLVYNPSTLDLTIVVPGQTTGFDVNGLLVQGGGAICASLDVAGAQFIINDPNAGTLTAVSSTVCFNNGTALLEATANGNANVPSGYQTIYVLTSGTGLVIEQVNATPSFSVTTGGLYTIHTLVYNPATLDLSIVVPGQTTGFDVNGLLVQGGGIICASLDVAGAPITVEDPNAGTLAADVSEACSFNISATPDGNANVPSGYQTIYVLTSGAGLVIEQVNTTPDFTVAANGLYTIHTLVYNPSTLDLTIVVPGQTTGFDVNGLLVQGGGAICASLDVAGAAFNISSPSAGTITSNDLSVCFSGGTATISGTPDGNTVVPAGFQVIYVLTSGTGLVIEQVNSTPTFNVTSQGLYTIHTLVYDPATLDLSIVVPGQTTGFDVNSLLVQGGGSICAALDVAGAPVVVGNPSAGTIQADDFISCISNGTAVISATPAGNAIVPPGFNTIYVLTRGFNLTIQQVSSTPTFNVNQIGFYRIHTLVYNPATLDLNIVVFGQTTGFDVNALLVQGGGTICASLDVQGAPVLVLGPIICDLFNLDAIATSDLDAQTIEELKAVAESGIDGQLLISKVYPNPASTFADVEFVQTVSGTINLSVYNKIGQKVIDQTFVQEEGTATKRIDLSGLVAGSYLIKIDNGINSVTRIIVVQN